MFAITGNRVFTLVWFGILLLVSFTPAISSLYDDWVHNDDMGHGFFVPLVSAYIIWMSRDSFQTPVKPNYWGLALVLFASLQFTAAVLGAEFFLLRTAFVFGIMGSVLLLAGTTNFRIVLFPLLLLFFMVPLPAIIYNQITFPLQLFASQVAELGLSAIGIPVLREGNIIELPSQRLSVVEACSGIRSLLSLSFLALVYGHFFDRRPGMKWLLLVVTVPIAVLANSFRVTMTGILSEVNPELASGFFHSAEGWIIFSVALAMLFAAHRAVSFCWDYWIRRRAA